MSKLTIGSVIVLVAIVFGFSILSSTESLPARQSVFFDTGWEFKKEGDSAWSEVILPHTVNIEPLVVNNQWQGISWYRTSLRLDDLKEKNVFLEFEGVMQEATLWVNGDSLLTHAGGYLPFIVNITGSVAEGTDNLIELRVDNRDNPLIPPGKPLNTLDFNYYGGIYRPVNLIMTNRVYISGNVEGNEPLGGGVLVHFDQATAERAIGELRMQVVNGADEEARISASTVLTGPDGRQVEFTSDETSVAPGRKTWLRMGLQVDQPVLWSVTDPSLYDIDVKLHADGKETDQWGDKIGIRSILLNEEGFFLNGEKIFIRGTNRHQEYPYVGYALSDDANFRDALKIKNAGFDFVRLSHYPHSESFLDACDQLGLLVMNAIPGWQWFRKDSAFLKNSFQDIRDMVRRDRNHPSVAFWEVSLNESGMSKEYMVEANRILREELPFPDAYSAGWIDHETYDLFIPARQHNKPPDYWNFYKEGRRKILIAEYGDWEYYAHNAGFNQKAFADLQEEERTSRQLRGSGERRLLQQAMNYQEAANSNRKGINAGTIGHANWLMFDYNRGYADDIESSGISDIFRIPKFAYYLYQSQRDASERINHPLVDSGPMIKIASYWTGDSPLNIKVFSNCDEIALYLNDQMIAKQSPTKDQFSDHLKHPPFVFRLERFTPGTLKAIGFISGSEVVQDVVKTPGPPVGVRLSCDISGRELNKESKDVLFVYAEIIDAHGTIVTESKVPVTFVLTGGGQLVGENPVKAEAGVATILYQSGEGTLPQIRAKAAGLKEATITFAAAKAK